MAAQDERALSLSSNETCYDWKDASGVVHRVPEDILEALKEPFRGQSNFGPQHKFCDRAALTLWQFCMNQHLLCRCMPLKHL